MKGNGHDDSWSKPKIDLKDLAERCQIASNAVELPTADQKLFAECADVMRAIDNLIQTFPEVVRRNREAQYLQTCQTVAGALDDVAMEYDAGRRQHERTPSAALRYFAKSLRESLKPKESKLVM